MHLRQFQEEMSKGLVDIGDSSQPSSKLLSMISVRLLKPSEALGIYRNNIYQNLKEALENHFPLSRLLLGTDYFSHLAQLYIKNFPYTQSDLNFYGQELPNFTASQVELRNLDYLQDFMKLELLYQELYYAPENSTRHSKCTDRNAYFQKLLNEAPPEKSYLHLSSAVRLLSSSYPLLSIWKYCLQAEKQGTDFVHKGLKLRAEPHNIILCRKDGRLYDGDGDGGVYLEKADAKIWPLLQAISRPASPPHLGGASIAQLSTDLLANHTPTEIIQKLSFLLERNLLES